MSASTVQADEIGEREAIYQAVSGSLKHGDFASLDRLAEQERSDKAMTSAGTPLLGEFYRYVEGSASTYAPNPTCGFSKRKMSEDWLKSRPESVAAQIIYAQSLVDLAFCARGRNVADKVSKTAWPVFNNYIREARDYLETHESASYSDPEWFCVMEDVANAQSWDQRDFLSLLKRGAAQYPLYYRLWYGGMWYYTPQWNGSNEDTESFVRGAVDDTKSLIGTDIYARLYRWIANNNNSIRDLKTDTNVDWNYMKKSIRSVTDRYPDPLNLIGFTILLCKAKDYDEVDYYIHKMLPDPRAALAWPVTARNGHCDDLAYIDSPVYPVTRPKPPTGH